MTIKDPASAFPKALPALRLGRAHSTLDEYRQAINFSASSSKEYSLIVVTESKTARILLGLKNRGFGIGMFNSFGGKLEEEESVEGCACRELYEETNIFVPLSDMIQCKVGIQQYTFEDSPTEMIMHLFRIDLDPASQHKVKGCEEITPRWFDNWHQIPLDNMFADDSLWLSLLLSSPTPLLINGWYHFQAGGQETNTILHHHLDVQDKATSN
jgi:8-oxo-dGTP pyrophosphatase MutT (NUDIX family)